MSEFFDATMLARIQFAFTISAHIIFPAFTIGLASYLAVLEGLWLWRGDDRYMKVFHYWKTIFAIAFGMGVVSGIVMSYQFGTNWSVFSDRTGPILGPLLGYEVLTAFFLEAGFLGIMLFGLDRVGPRLHFVATVMVALGTLLSAFWILSANSWMHTPAGFALNEVGQYVPADWWAVIFNPSFPYRFVHMVLAAYLTTALVVGGAGAWHLLRDSTDEGARIMFSMAMWMALLVAPLQVIAGDLHGVNTFEHQPAKIAAIEGHWESGEGLPLILFGIPDDTAEETRYKLEIPNLGSWILTHEWDGRVEGLKAWPADQRPPSEVVFWTFRIMVAIGFAMVALGLSSLVARLRRRFYEARWLLWSSVVMAPSGFAAVLAGWVTTEVGRQPWTVYNELTTADSVSQIAAPAVASSLAAFVVIYFAVFGAGTFYILRLMSKPPRVKAEEDIGPLRAAGITPAPAVEAHRRRRAAESREPR